MALQWFKKWHKRRAKQEAEVARAWEWEVQVASSRAYAALCHNTRHALYQVSEDLLHMICQYLSDSEIVTLMLSCSAFWRCRRGDGVLARAWKRMALPAGEELCRMTTRFYVLRMLEHDGFPQTKRSPERYCCWGCMKTHERQAFSAKELEKKVDLKAKEDCYLEENARFCDPAARYIWFGACQEMSFAELRHITAHPHTQQRQEHQKHPVQLAEGWTDLRRNDATSFLQEATFFNREERRLAYRIHLIATPNVPTSYWFKRHVRKVNLPLCPHLRMGDRAMVRLYNQSLQTWRCRHCTTAVKVGVQPQSQCVSVHVFRYLGELHSPKDPAWMAQSYRARSPYLKDHCRGFCSWFQTMYGKYGVVTHGGGFWSFEPEWPRAAKFRGVARYKPEWEKGGPYAQKQ